MSTANETSSSLPTPAGSSAATRLALSVPDVADAATETRSSGVAAPWFSRGTATAPAATTARAAHETAALRRNRTRAAPAYTARVDSPGRPASAAALSSKFLTSSLTPIPPSSRRAAPPIPEPHGS